MAYYLTKRQRRLLPLWLFLVAYGFDFELSAFYTIEASSLDYLLLLLSALTLSFYIIPAFFLIRKVVRTQRLDKDIILMGLLSGLFVTGWLASYGNAFLGMFWELILSKKVFTEWESALTAPIVEEFLKTGFAFFVLFFFKKWNKSLVFFTGLVTGLGFQIIEDLAYVATEAALDMNTAMPTALSRLSGALSSHYLYSSLITLGIYLMATKAKDLPGWKIRLWAFGPVVIHFIWNSPLNQSTLTIAILTGMSLWLFIDAIGYALYNKTFVEHQ
ncbi:PrsW family glutamic-type intramembrane protease [Streptococcus fryi]